MVLVMSCLLRHMLSDRRTVCVRCRAVRENARLEAEAWKPGVKLRVLHAFWQEPEHAVKSVGGFDSFVRASPTVRASRMRI